MEQTSNDKPNLDGVPPFLTVEALVEASDDAIIGKTLDNRIISWNRGAEKLYGYTAQEAVGQPVTLIVPPERQTEPEQIIRQILRGERVNIMDTVRITKAGLRINISLIVSPVRDVEGNITCALTIGRDITEQQEAKTTLAVLQQSSEDHALVLETANRVALDILNSRTGIEALRRIVEAAQVLARARYAALGVARSDGQGLTEFITSGLTSEQEAVIGSRPQGVGILGLLLTRTEPLRIDRLADHPHAGGFPPNHPPMESFLGVPIRRGDETLGSLYMTNKEGGASFTEADEVAVQALGAYAAVAIHNLNLLARQRALVSGLIAAQEEERRAVAYDLHDGLTQFVMASHAHLEAFRRAQSIGKQERAARELDQGLRYLKDAVVESRRMVNGLRSLALDDLGLAGALEQLIEEEKERAGWEDARLLHNIAGRRYHKTLETTIYRVAQEAMTNARKHANTKRVQIALLYNLNSSAVNPLPPYLTLEIRDWGCGFIPEKAAGGEGHVGLQSMVERVHLLNGVFTLDSQPGLGTTVRAVFTAVDPTSDEEGTETNE